MTLPDPLPRPRSVRSGLGTLSSVAPTTVRESGPWSTPNGNPVWAPIPTGLERSGEQGLTSSLILCSTLSGSLGVEVSGRLDFPVRGATGWGRSPWLWTWYPQSLGRETRPDTRWSVRVQPGTEETRTTDPLFGSPRDLSAGGPESGTCRDKATVLSEGHASGRGDRGSGPVSNCTRTGVRLGRGRAGDRSLRFTVGTTVHLEPVDGVGGVI